MTSVLAFLGFNQNTKEDAGFCREHYFGVSTHGSPCAKCSCVITESWKKQSQ